MKCVSSSFIAKIFRELVWQLLYNKFQSGACNASVLVTFTIISHSALENHRRLADIFSSRHEARRLGIRLCNISLFSERELKFMFAMSSAYVCLSVCLSVVCLSSNVGAPYSDDWNFRQCFYALCYLGHSWPLYKNVTKIVPGEPLRWGVKPKRGSQI